MRLLPVVAKLVALGTLAHVLFTLVQLHTGPAAGAANQAMMANPAMTAQPPLFSPTGQNHDDHHHESQPPPPPMPPWIYAENIANVLWPPPPPTDVRKLITEPILVAEHGQSSGFSLPAACKSARLRAVLALECNYGKAQREAADEAADAAALQAALVHVQHPADCASEAARGGVHTFKDWRNGLGAQISSLVGAWAAVLAKHAAAPGSGGRIFPGFRPSGSAGGGIEGGGGGGPSRLLIPLGGLRYANKARCPARDLSCYFLPFSGCEAPETTKNARAKKTPPALASEVSHELRLRRTRDKWWLRKELTRYVFRPNRGTARMLAEVRDEMGLSPPLSHDGRPRHAQPLEDDAAARAAGSPDEARREAGASVSGGRDGSAALRTDQLVGLHIRRGDKRDLGAKERGEPFSDAQYVQAALALADEIGAAGFLLASSEPDTLRRLPAMLRPRPTFVMPARHFVQVPEGLTPHQVIEKTRQEGGSNDEGRSQIVQLLLLSECAAFLGTVTSNFGQLVTKLMAFRTPRPLALDLSCEGLTSMQGASASPQPEVIKGSDGGESLTSHADGVWRLPWPAADAARCAGFRRREAVPPRRKGK